MSISPEEIEAGRAVFELGRPAVGWAWGRLRALVRNVYTDLVAGTAG